MGHAFVDLLLFASYAHISYSTEYAVFTCFCMLYTFKAVHRRGAMVEW